VAHPRFAAAVELVASALARFEVAVAALEQLGSDDPRAERLDREAHRWHRAAMAGLGELGLTPKSAAALGVDLAAVAASAHRAELLERGRALRLTHDATLELDGEGGAA
jgi:hypothetical protein